jgi:hypothetical protein
MRVALLFLPPSCITMGEEQEGHMRARISITVLAAGAVALALAGWTGGFAAPHPALFADNRPSAVVVDAELVIAVDVWKGAAKSRPIAFRPGSTTTKRCDPITIAACARQQCPTTALTTPTFTTC